MSIGFSKVFSKIFVCPTEKRRKNQASHPDSVLHFILHSPEKRCFLRQNLAFFGVITLIKNTKKRLET